MTELVQFTPQVVAELPDNETVEVEDLSQHNPHTHEASVATFGFATLATAGFNFFNPELTDSMALDMSSITFLAFTALFSLQVIKANIGIISETTRNKITVGQLFSSLPLLGHLHKTKIITQTGDDEYKMLTIGGNTETKRLTMQPKDPIDSWDNLFELETGEKVEGSL